MKLRNAHTDARRVTCRHHHVQRSVVLLLVLLVCISCGQARPSAVEAPPAPAAGTVASPPASTPARSATDRPVEADLQTGETAQPGQAGTSANVEDETAVGSPTEQAHPPSPSGIQATLVVSAGEAEVSSGSTRTLLSAGEVLAVQANDTLSLGEESAATLTFSDGSTVELFGGAVLSLAELSGPQPSRVQLDLIAGRVFSRIHRLLDEGQSFEITTPSSTAAVRGTAFGVEVINPDSAYTYTLEGRVTISMGEQAVDVLAGEAVMATWGEELKVQPHGQYLAGDLGVPYEEIMAWFDSGYGFGQIKQIYHLSQEASVAPEDIGALLEAGLGLGSAKKAVDLHVTYGISFEDILAKVEAGLNMNEIERELEAGP